MRTPLRRKRKRNETIAAGNLRQILAAASPFRAILLGVGRTKSVVIKEVLNYRKYCESVTM